MRTGPIELEVFDKDPHAVATAKRNIAAFGRYMPEFSANVFEADWDDDALWRYLQQNPVHFLISNPPYLPTSHADGLAILSKSSGHSSAYAMTSPSALDGGSDGLDHVRTLLRRAPGALVDQGPTSIFLRYSFHSDKDELNRAVDESFGNTVSKDFRSFQGVGPSSLGQSLNDITGGDVRILATVAVRRRPVRDVVGSADISSPQAEMSVRHAAALGGVILSANQSSELLGLRELAGLSFAEEEILIGGLRYLAVNMRRPHYSGVGDIYELPRWELKDVINGIGRSRVIELTRLAAR